jgi:hypothetical protein
LRQSRNYAALHETQHQVDETPSPAGRQPRNYDAVRDTQHQVDRDAEESPKRPAIQRSWTHLGGMVPQQKSANDWIEQNQEIRMSDRRDSGSGRDGQGAQPEAARDENDPELQEARAIVEEARRREAAERARLQERDRGMER